MKNLFTIAPDLSFLDELALGLRQRATHGVALADMQLFLPTRRACRLLREAFLKNEQGAASLLPRLQPLGEIDEEEWLFADSDLALDIPPAIAPLRRRMLLAQLIRARDAAMGPDQAVLLAEALTKFLDEAQIRRCDFSKLPDLVTQRELAEHWQQTVRFLNILTDAWPSVLAAEGCIDPADRRNRLLAAQIALWREKPPLHPIIAAGSTGSMPATAEFLDAIASLPAGIVVLPGLDQGMDEESWQAVDDLHPQHAMKKLLRVMDTDRAAVKPWASASGAPRSQLLREAMRPAAVTEKWRELKAGDISADAMSGLSYAAFAHPQEEAQGIALMLRRALDQPGKTAALVTPDRDLAARVTSLLARWGIAVDDSAGQSLSERPCGAFLTAILAAAKPDAGPVAWLSLLKHPIAACGVDPAVCRSRARHAEMTVWRHTMPQHDAWLDEVSARFAPLNRSWKQTRALTEWLRDHRTLAEIIAASDVEAGASRLWQGEDGEVAADWFADLENAAADFAPIDGQAYHDLFTGLLRQARFRPAYGRHPRLGILGPLEARLLRPDLIVLGSLNEGSWPPDAETDPWMSRPMKRDFGMNAPEYRIGLSAHDFAQLAAAPEVILTRARRSGGAPTVPSRFVLQLETVLRALDRDGALVSAEPWPEWARLLDEPAAIMPCEPPAPRPGAALRPKRLSVTEIGTWQRNPYAIYARHVLGLRKLEPLEAELDAADRGNLIHRALERFMQAHRAALPADALQKLLAIGKELFATYGAEAEIAAFWWPRFERIAAWFVAREVERRAAGLATLALEAKGHITFGDFVLTGRADRIDRMPDDELALIDYKTGGVPTKDEVLRGLEPQLPLLALIAMRGGFADMPAAKTGQLAYWKLAGGRDEESNKDTLFEGIIENLSMEAEQGLKELIALFADPRTPYEAAPKPGRAPRFDDYAHLARYAEWGRAREE